MPDIGLRNLGTIIPGAQRKEPSAAAPVPSAARQAAEPAPLPPLASPLGSIFAADAPDAADAMSSDPFGLDAPLNLLAELAAHARTETPLTIGLLGRPGSGKSLALLKLGRSIESLSAAARGAGETPFLTKILTLRIDAADLEGAPGMALAEALYAGLAADYPALALEATHAARDPRLAARELSSGSTPPVTSSRPKDRLSSRPTRVAPSWPTPCSMKRVDPRSTPMLPPTGHESSTAWWGLALAAIQSLATRI